jgi:thiol-disulfide isomerase/thioredoxin
MMNTLVWAGQTTRLTIRVIDPKPDAQVGVSTYQSDLSEVEKEEQLVLLKDQEFYVETFLESPQVFKLKYDGRSFDLYLEPGDDLTLSFEANKFPSSLYFLGKGTEHNTYLVKYREKFNNNRDNILTNYINNFTPSEFKKWMTEVVKRHWEFYHGYDGLEKERFSPAFVSFACAEINYWYAYHLLRYKQEHEQGNVLSQFIQIPESYYDFLNGVIINNDEALANPLYRKFLKLYLKFRSEFPSSFIGLASKQSVLKVKVPSMEVLANPTSKVLGYITEGTKVLVLEKLTFNGATTTTAGLPTAYRIKIRTNDGQEGWIKTSGLEFEQEPVLNRQGMTIEGVEITSKKAITKAKVGFPYLNVMSEPYENSIIETLKSEEEVIYLNQKTDQVYDYKAQDSSIYKAIFYKVRTESGRIGWICSCGVRLIEKQVEDKLRRQRIAQKSKNNYNNIDFLLYGKSRLFALATDIEYRLHFEQVKDVKAEYDAFLRENSSNYLKREVDTIFQKAVANPIPTPATQSVSISITGAYDITLNTPQLRFRVEVDPSAIINTNSTRPNINRTYTANSTTNKSTTNNNSTANVSTTNTPVIKPKLQIGTSVNINKKAESTPVTIATPQTIATTTNGNTKEPQAVKRNPTAPATIGNVATPSVSKSSNTAALSENSTPKEFVMPKKIEVKMPNSQYELISSSIKGKVTDPRGLNVSLTLMMDVINHREATYTTKIKTDNTFNLEFFLAEPAVGELVCGYDTIAVYIEPNDQIELELNGKDKSFLSCSGVGGSHIMFLDGFNNFSKPIDRQLKAKMRTLTAEPFKEFMQQAFQTKKQFLDNYQSKNLFSSTFLQFAEADINYWYAFNMVNYPWEYPLYFSEAPPAKVPPNYYDFLQKMKIQNDIALPSKNYRYFLDQYISDLKRKSENQNATVKDIAEKNFSNKTLAYCRAKQISQDLSYDINSLKINAVKNYVVNSSFPLYNEAVVASLYKQLPVQSGASAPSFRLMDANGKEVTLEELKGKIIYLDFWATWCAPCIQALPHTERIRQRFNENDVVFLYINLDEDKYKWLRYLEEHHLGGKHVSGNSPNPYRESVSALYQATKLPSTVIIDRNGNIAADANERLDSEAAAMRIQNLISK